LHQEPGNSVRKRTNFPAGWDISSPNLSPDSRAAPPSIPFDIVEVAASASAS